MVLTNHFFHSKETLACQILSMISAYTSLFCSVTHPCPDPLHRHVLAMRIRILFLLKSSYRTFYLDTLRQDILFSKLEKTPSRIFYQLADLYRFPADDDLFLLYGTYTPYNYELQKMSLYLSFFSIGASLGSFSLDCNSSDNP